MKELKILAVVVFFSLVTYYGVEPYAHSQMHKHVEGHGFAYADLNASTKKGNAEKGKELVMGAGACLGCHSLNAENMPAPMDAVSAAGAYGVNPPDLSVVGALLDEKFLADLIANPAHALKVEHKFDVNAGKMHPMVAFFGAGGDKDQEIADMVAYLKEIGEKQKVTPKVAYENACGRCHAMRYAKWTQIGSVPKTKPNITTHQDIEKLKFDQQVATYQESLAKYMGKLPPDLSIMIRARSKHFMETFVEDPQSQLTGTAMPRVGLTKEGYEKVEAYLEEIGDPSKPHREAVGPWVLGFFFIFMILAYLWKQAHWRDLH